MMRIGLWNSGQSLKESTLVEMKEDLDLRSTGEGGNVLVDSLDRSCVREAEEENEGSTSVILAHCLHSNYSRAESQCFGGSVLALVVTRLAQGTRKGESSVGRYVVDTYRGKR
jgi:hypothetical protein